VQRTRCRTSLQPEWTSVRVQEEIRAKKKPAREEVGGLDLKCSDLGGGVRCIYVVDGLGGGKTVNTHYLVPRAGMHQR